MTKMPTILPWAKPGSPSWNAPTTSVRSASSSTACTPGAAGRRRPRGRRRSAGAPRSSVAARRSTPPMRRTISSGSLAMLLLQRGAGRACLVVAVEEGSAHPPLRRRHRAPTRPPSPLRHVRIGRGARGAEMLVICRRATSRSAALSRRRRARLAACSNQHGNGGVVFDALDESTRSRCGSWPRWCASTKRAWR